MPGRKYRTSSKELKNEIQFLFLGRDIFYLLDNVALRINLLTACFAAACFDGGMNIQAEDTNGTFNQPYV